MQRRKLLLSLAIVIIAILTLSLSSCGNEGQSIEGKNVVTFELNGGILELKTSSVDTKINFAYHPGTYILDPSEIPGYKLFRQDYNFTGWYTSSECKPGEEWNFETPFETETLTLYAGWEKAIKFTYGVYYVQDGESFKLGSYDVKEGAIFEDWRSFAALRKDHTPLGYYFDTGFTTPWDASYTHPGGDVDTEIPVYVNYMEGNWKLVDDFSKLRSALRASENVYLTADIDCAGMDLGLSSIYNGILEGNGYTVRGLKAVKNGTLRPAVSIFKDLGKNAEIRNVNFADVEYDFTDIKENPTALKVASLAISSTGAKITNVSVTGTITTNYAGELPMLNQPVYEPDSETVVNGFTADINVVIQN